MNGRKAKKIRYIGTAGRLDSAWSETELIPGTARWSRPSFGQENGFLISAGQVRLKSDCQKYAVKKVKKAVKSGALRI